jgi:histidinol-phosphate aminotransferase
VSAEPRPGLRDTTPYHSPQLDVAARLNTNECPRPLPQGFAEDLAAVVRGLSLHRYPDSQMTLLREGLADHADHPVAGTWAANGSNEILTQLLQAYGGQARTAVTFEPTYLLHTRLAWLTQTRVVPLRLPADFVLTESDVVDAAAATPDVVFVCSPNNPTGNAQPVQVTEALATALPRALVIVDEAYHEFGGETALKLVADHPNVAVVRTFSKAFAMAGARIGYLLAAPAVVEDLQRVRLPYHLSALSQAAGIVGLRHHLEALSIVEAMPWQTDPNATPHAQVPRKSP